jgi:urea transport system substrate-binding protein
VARSPAPNTVAAHRLRSAGSAGAGDRPLDVALVIPLHGPAGIVGPSSELCAQLAMEELNAERGVLGREVRLTTVDGSGEPVQVARQVEALVSSGRVEAVAGWHLSALRQAMAPRIAPHVPYVYSALYEGGEHTPGVFLTGETPRLQLRPAIRWLVENLGVRRWTVVGDDYVWPLRSATRAQRYLRECGAELVDQIFVPLGTAEFRDALKRVERADADAVLMLLVGDDAVQFNRQFAASRLDQRCCRLSPLMAEHMLLASGAEATRDLYSAAGYFESLVTTSSLDFGARFTRRFGADAPSLNSPGQSCYEALRLLAELVTEARSTDVRAVCAVADAVHYEGARGPVRLRGNHLEQPIYLARADGLEFDVIATL